MLEQEAMVSCLVLGHLQENGSIITENFFISNIEELSNTPAIFCSQLLVPLVNFPSIVSVQGPSFKVTIHYITLLSLQWQVGKIKYCTIKHILLSPRKIYVIELTIICIWESHDWLIYVCFLMYFLLLRLTQYSENNHLWNIPRKKENDQLGSSSSDVRIRFNSAAWRRNMSKNSFS